MTRNLDLGPNDYRKQDARTGRWRLPDDPKIARWGVLAMAAVLAYVFFYRDELSTLTLFGGAAMPAFAGGILFAIWLKDVP